jgi:hypothetical protein
MPGDTGDFHIHEAITNLGRVSTVQVQRMFYL